MAQPDHPAKPTVDPRREQIVVETDAAGRPTSTHAAAPAPPADLKTAADVGRASRAEVEDLKSDAMEGTSPEGRSPSLHTKRSMHMLFVTVFGLLLVGGVSALIAVGSPPMYFLAGVFFLLLCLVAGVVWLPGVFRKQEERRAEPGAVAGAEPGRRR